MGPGAGPGARFAVQVWVNVLPPRPGATIDPVIVLPFSVPEYLATPSPTSTEKATILFVKLASLITDCPLRVLIEPVSCPF